jgi:hypothetical protein
MLSLTRSTHIVAASTAAGSARNLLLRLKLGICVDLASVAGHAGDPPFSLLILCGRCMYDTSQISLPHVDELPVLHPGIDQALQADLSVGKNCNLHYTT